MAGGKEVRAYLPTIPSLPGQNKGCVFLASSSYGSFKLIAIPLISLLRAVKKNLNCVIKAT